MPFIHFTVQVFFELLCARVEERAKQSVCPPSTGNPVKEADKKEVPVCYQIVSGAVRKYQKEQTSSK